MGKRPSREISRSEVEFAIHEWIIGQNAERNRHIISRYLFDGITMERLAEEVDMSSRQIQNIIRKCENIVFSHIPA